MNNDIERALRLHEKVYLMSGEPIPPFRMTYQECLQLNSIMIKRGFAPAEIRYSPIAHYMGFDIEIVVPLK